MIEAIKVFLQRLLGLEIAPGKPLPPHVEKIELHPDILALHILKTSDVKRHDIRD